MSKVKNPGLNFLEVLKQQLTDEVVDKVVDLGHTCLEAARDHVNGTIDERHLPPKYAGRLTPVPSPDGNSTDRRPTIENDSRKEIFKSLEEKETRQSTQSTGSTL